jgi:hypothetical protein
MIASKGDAQKTIESVGRVCAATVIARASAALGCFAALAMTAGRLDRAAANSGLRQTLSAGRSEC